MVCKPNARTVVPAARKSPTDRLSQSAEEGSELEGPARLPEHLPVEPDLENIKQIKREELAIAARRQWEAKRKRMAWALTPWRKRDDTSVFIRHFVYQKVDLARYKAALAQAPADWGNRVRNSTGNAVRSDASILLRQLEHARGMIVSAYWRKHDWVGYPIARAYAMESSIRPVGREEDTWAPTQRIAREIRAILLAALCLDLVVGCVDLPFGRS